MQGARPFGPAIRAVRRPVQFVQYLFVRQIMRSGAFPRDATSGEVAGSPTKRLVIVGEATAAGYGTVSHQLSIAGHLARVLAARDGVGVSWQVAPFADLTVRTARTGMSDDALLSGADVVVVMLGVGDTVRMTSTQVWSRMLDESLGALEAVLDPGAEVIISEIPPLGDVALLPIAMRPFAGRRAEALNAATRRLVGDRPHVRVGPFPRGEVPALGTDDPTHISGIYRAWAAALLGPSAG